jgi:hypothetical protein
LGPFAERKPDPEGQDEWKMPACIARTCQGLGEHRPQSQGLLPIWRTFCAKVRGHLRYYGVSFNHHALEMFIRQATRIMYKWLNRRSQRRSFNWEKFQRFMDQHPPPVVYTSFLIADAT